MAGIRRISGPGAQMMHDGIRFLLAAQDKCRDAANMASAVYATGNSGKSLESSQEFEAPAGEGQAVNDEINSFATALDAFMTTHVGTIAQYNRG